MVKEENKNKIIGKLSILVGTNKKGDIVVREGDNLHMLVKNFMVSYGLKREMLATILLSLEKLVQNKHKKDLE